MLELGGPLGTGGTVGVGCCELAGEPGKLVSGGPPVSQCPIRLGLGRGQFWTVRGECVAGHPVRLAELAKLTGEVAELLAEGVPGLPDPGQHRVVTLQRRHRAAGTVGDIGKVEEAPAQRGHPVWIAGRRIAVEVEHPPVTGPGHVQPPQESANEVVAPRQAPNQRATTHYHQHSP